MRKKAIWVDLDGTLFNIDHRLHFIQKSPQDWDGFLDAIPGDTVNGWCLALIWAMRLSGHDIVYVTGRSDSSEQHTRDQLMKAMGPMGMTDALHMRPRSDQKHDREVKIEILHKLRPLYDIVFAIEDRPSVCRALRLAGLVVLQCQDREF